jgi:hypothetical protein
VLEPWAKLQAILQGILQGAGPGGCYYKVLTGLFVIGSSFLVLRVLGVLGALGALGALDRLVL